MADDGIVKASVYEIASKDDSRLQPGLEDENFFSSINAIEPPYDLDFLTILYERSSALRPNVEALATNVDSFGYTLKPAIDLEAPNADEKIRDTLFAEALFDGTLPDLREEAVQLRRFEIEAQQRAERLRTKFFFDSICVDISFTQLRKNTRTELEVTGNGYWEILRNQMNEIAGACHVPAISMRMLPIDRKFTDVERAVRVSDFSIRKLKERRRFRRYVQWSRGFMEGCFFKEFGDPRTISSRSGKFYENEAELAKVEPNALPGTEILHFRIHSTRSIYGVPRWVGAWLAVVGTRESEEVNAHYFKNKTIPPYAILVSGGKLAAGASQKIIDHLQGIRGADAFTSVLVLEAESSGGSGAAISSAAGGGARCRIEIKSMIDAQQSDALFQQYEANNALKVGAQFRIPKLLKGDQSDANRSTSEEATKVAEQQVFQPERMEFDFQMDRLLVDRDVRLMRFSSNGPVERDPQGIVEMVTRLTDAGVITPNEAREPAADALDIRLDKVSAPWARIPVKAAQAGFAPEATPEEIETGTQPQAPVPGAGTLGAEAMRLVAIRDALRTAEGRTDAAALGEARRNESEKVIQVDRSTFDSWFEQPDASEA